MRPLSIYLHWPFCARICPYCDFNVARARNVDTDRWSRAFASELSYWANETRGRRVATLYFGGGTPSLAPPSLLATLIEKVDALWGFSSDPEITLEANPTDAERGRYADFRRAGVNRLSIGLQSLDNDALEFLGRDHSAAEGVCALASAMSIFPRVSADLIYARPQQSAAQWEGELRRAIETGLRHLSLYQLTIEDGTAFGKQVEKRRWTPADDDLCADLFDITQSVTAAAGLPAYEISNHAAAGEQSRHNLAYWRQDDYLGVGPGAHGRLDRGGGRIATETERDLKRYLARIDADGVGVAAIETLSADAALTERLAMGLRTTEGAILSNRAWEKIAPAAARALSSGLLVRDGARLVATPDGRRILDSVLAQIVP